MFKILYATAVFTFCTITSRMHEITWLLTAWYEPLHDPQNILSSLKSGWYIAITTEAVFSRSIRDNWPNFTFKRVIQCEHGKLCSVQECCWYIHTYALEVRCRAPCFQVLPLSLKVVPVCLTHPPSLPHLKKKSNSRNRFTVNVLVRNSFHAPTRRLAEMVINSRPVLLPRQNVYWFVSVVIGP